MSQAPAILALGTATPSFRYSQREIYDLVARSSSFYQTDRIRQLFMNSDIDFRHLYLDMDTFRLDETIDAMHTRFRQGALEVGKQAIRNCLDNGHLPIREIDAIICVSCTGYLCPGLSSLLIEPLGMRTNVQRADLLGMGCAGAMPGLQRAYDFVKAYPDRKALLLTVEICSACYYLDDSLETVVGNAICADGAAAAIVGMSDISTVPKIIGFETHLEPSLIDKVGFEQRDGRLRIILSKDIRNVAGSLARTTVDALLANYQCNPEDIDHWILHSGGRKVIESLKASLQLSDEQVRHSTCVLRNYGNMSSPTVLFVLDEALRNGRPKPGDTGLMLAMGPGLAIEGALLRW